MLTAAEIKERLKKPTKKLEIDRAVSQQRKLCLHCKTTLNRHETEGLNSFLNWVKTLIPFDKYVTFEKLLLFPVKTVSTTETIFEALEKVFDGRNPVFDYNFTSSDYLEDWKEFSKKDKDFWKTKAFEAMKTAINSIMIVDLPREQIGQQPEPYIYLLDISNVLDLELDNEEIQDIIFEQPGDTIAYFSSTHLQVFDYTDQKVGQELNNIAHDLGYCPAKFFWSTNIDEKGIVKKQPLSNFLALLDWLLFFAVSKDHLNLYAPYPIMSAYEDNNCSYINDETGVYCKDGWLLKQDGSYLIDRGLTKPVKCPVCNKSKLAGAGSFIKVPVPQAANDFKDLRNPVSILQIDRDSLDYNVSETERLKKELYKGVVGIGGEINKDQAINEKQIMGAFESRKQALFKIKKNFETAQKWADSTRCRLRYGTNFIDCSISYGTDFYLFTPSELLEMYTEARKEQLDPAILDNLLNEYYQVKYRNNIDEGKRVILFNHLDPFRHSTKSEVSAMYAAGQIEYNDYFLKINFSTLVKRFERENGNIILFGIELEDFNRRIEIINEALRGYIEAPQVSPATTI